MVADPLQRPLLSVKQTAPPVRAGAVARGRLEKRLDLATKLTLVVAPAGWGKTSLLSRWVSGADGTRIAWVSLDESDDEPVRFWSYALTALRGVSDQITSAALDALPASSDGPMAHALPLLLNELAATSTPHVLVLDDYHVISHQDVHESLEFLLAYLPPTLRIVIASRMDPPLPLARMRVRGELNELRADDLRFSLDESATLVSTVSETEVDAHTAAAVWERTEGWAAGLQLAALAVRGNGAGPVLGDDRHLFDYFTDEVFPALAPQQRELLVRAAPLELLSGPLCDSALGVDGSAAVLAELEAADLFVVALDHTREWYRCHRLLRDALLRTPEAHSDESKVLRRAARWFEEHGRIDDAVRHLLRAGDLADAERMLAGQIGWFLQRGWHATYLALGEQLPEHAVRSQLAVYLAYAADLTGRRDQVVHWLDLAERKLDADTVITYWRSPRAGILALRGVLGTPESQPALAVRLCEEAVALETAAGYAENPDAQAALGRAYGLDARFDEGARLLADCWRRRDQFPWSTERVLQVAGQLSLCLLGVGREQELDSLLAQAGAIADQTERDWGPAAAAHVVTLVRIVEARRTYQRGDLVRAREQLVRGQALAELTARPMLLVLGFVFLADVEVGAGHRAAANAALVRAREVADNDAVAPFVRTWLQEAETRIGRQAAKAATGVLFEELTDRELSILRMLPGTATQREIGAALFLSINTVKAYNKSLYRKLDVASRADAVRAARRLGII
ncbi:LuxR C-terminal-related transcriptional regulator [Kribbella sp. NPDC058693]|uniref:LuxR C-terminal-related transcriptional regulator n=1 Tax=Kribbella sp. NPDC058693 TaxID=3346602 RepID=UPI0036505656